MLNARSAHLGADVIQNRLSSINRTPSGANAGGGILTDRGEGVIHDKVSLARDVAMGVLARSMDLNIYNLHQAHSKRVDEIVADNKPPFDVFCKAFLNMPGGMDYSRAIVVASVKEAPIGIEAIPARVTEYLNRVLTETDHAIQFRQRIQELEAKLETADKLQDSAFRDGLKAGFSYGQTDDQSGFAQCMSAYSTRAGIKVKGD